MAQVCAAVAGVPQVESADNFSCKENVFNGDAYLSVDSIVHGVISNGEVHEQLKEEGDFFVIRCSKEPSRLFLVVKLKYKVVKIEVVRSPVGFVFKDGQLAVSSSDTFELFAPRKLRLSDGQIEYITLRRPVQKSLYHMVHNDVNMNEKIGYGSYGKVYAGEMSKLPVAVKQLYIKKGKGSSDELRNECLKEAKLMSHLNGHLNVVEVYGVVDVHRPYCIVMELCPTGSVERLLRLEGKRVTTSDRICLALQAARGLSWLHSKGIIHRDLAARNCLLAGQTLKLADFGMSRELDDCAINPDEPQNVRWMAPELWHTGKVTVASDIYAFGVLLWELFAIPSRKPYVDLDGYEVKKLVMSGGRLSLPLGMPFTVGKLAKNCWSEDPLSRPTAAEACKELDHILIEGTYDPRSCFRVFEALDENEMDLMEMEMELESL